MKILLILFYLLMTVCHYIDFTAGRKSKVFLYVTLIFTVFMLSGSNAADLDWSETELDVSGYRTLFDEYDVLHHQDFKMYYLFYSSMYLGQALGLSFRVWWIIMSALALGIVLIACRVHNYSNQLFFATFMAYYEFVMYSGLKFFYGFCVFLLAYGFLLRNDRRGRLLFAVFTCIAGGFHMMYYYYLIMLILPLKKPERYVKPFVIGVVIFTVLMRLSGSAVSFLAPFFNVINNEHVNRYTELDSVRMGFYIAVVLHLVLVYVVYRIRKYMIMTKSNCVACDVLFYSVLLSLFFCPFYSVALTFMRLLTAFSLTVMTASSSFMKDSYESRLLCRNMSLLLVLSFMFIQLVTGSGESSFWNVAIYPFFDVL